MRSFSVITELGSPLMGYYPHALNNEELRNAVSSRVQHLLTDRLFLRLVDQALDVAQPLDNREVKWWLLGKIAHENLRARSG